MTSTPSLAVEPSARSSRSRRELRLEPWLPLAVLSAASLLVALLFVHSTGSLFPDSARYTNAGAMIHDWLRSGDLAHPYAFALGNYAQYPAFNIPYHPPAYPGILGIVFLATGVSYTAARAVVAGSLAIVACVFYLILRRQGANPWPAFLGALVLITSPEVARWARDTMSEIPAMAFLLAGSWAILVWLEAAGKIAWLWLASALALLAFWCRITILEALPAWALYAWTVIGRGVFRPGVIVPGAVVVTSAALWLVWVVGFVEYEVRADGRSRGIGMSNLSFFAEAVPPLLPSAGWIAVALGMAAGVALYRYAAARFWLIWVGTVLVTKLLIATTPEPRHAILLVPALAGLTTCLFHPALPRLITRAVAPAALAVLLGANALALTQMPKGVVGYERVADALARLERPGNVLLACWLDQDLMFRYRERVPESTRWLLRADRTLTVRLANYAEVHPTVLATSAADVIDVVRRGRARYLLTVQPTNTMAGGVMTPEMRLAAAVAEQDGAFRALGRFPIELGIRPTDNARGDITIWEFTGTLPEGPSELPIVIPTIGVKTRPALRK